MELTYDVVVVGAGVAGLSAARRLARAGHRVAVVEARDRVGGRIHTLQVQGEPIELGAEFIHGRPPLLWALIRESGLGSYELDGVDFAYEDGRLRARGGQPGAARGVLGEMTAWLARQAPGTDLSFEDYLRSNPPDPAAADAAAAYVEGFNAADRHRIGVASLVRQQVAEDAIEGDRAFRLTGGYQALPEFLASELKNAGGRLYLNSPVRRIEWRRGSVRTAAAVDLRSRVALITVPLGVLQAGGIHFEPPPVEILEHARRMAMGNAVRATLRFERKFWPDTLSFLFAPSQTPATFWTPMPERAALITGWAGGPKAAALGRLGENGVLSCCLSTLAAVVDRPRVELERSLCSWHVHDWSADPFARGAYSYVPAGALDASEGMTRPVGDTLYFAGEHTDVSGHWGTVHAALQSGTLAAERILDTL